MVTFSPNCLFRRSTQVAGLGRGGGDLLVFVFFSPGVSSFFSLQPKPRSGAQGSRGWWHWECRLLKKKSKHHLRAVLRACFPPLMSSLRGFAVLLPRWGCLRSSGFVFTPSSGCFRRSLVCCCLLLSAEATPKQSLTRWVKFGEVLDGFEALRSLDPGGKGAEGWEVVLGVSRELQV